MLGGESRSDCSHVLIKLSCEVTLFERAYINGQLRRVAFVLIGYSLLTDELRIDLAAEVLLPTQLELIQVQSVPSCIGH